MVLERGDVFTTRKHYYVSWGSIKRINTMRSKMFHYEHLMDT